MLRTGPHSKFGNRFVFSAQVPADPVVREYVKSEQGSVFAIRQSGAEPSIPVPLFASS